MIKTFNHNTFSSPLLLDMLWTISSILYSVFRIFTTLFSANYISQNNYVAVQCIQQINNSYSVSQLKINCLGDLESSRRFRIKNFTLPVEKWSPTPTVIKSFFPQIINTYFDTFARYIHTLKCFTKHISLIMSWLGETKEKQIDQQAA